MNHTLIHLKEQKYAGITTKILFKDHDATNFLRLQLDVVEAGIAHIDPAERFLALDSDFQADGFSYTPLLPVTAFEGEAHTRFTQQAGEYYCFEVDPKDLNPQWFQTCYAYMVQNDIQIDQSFDLEYYPAGYAERLQSEGEDMQLHPICLIFRKKAV